MFPSAFAISFTPATISSSVMAMVVPSDYSNNSTSCGANISAGLFLIFSLWEIIKQKYRQIFCCYNLYDFWL